LWGIVGLGNPGRKYSRTRHNIGFLVISEIAQKHGIQLKEKLHYRSAKGSINDTEVVLIEPLTFMNKSGIAVKEALRRFKFTHEKLIVIHDDIDMETGRVKIKTGGSSGGHRGVESIIESIGTKDFIRVKIGIGRDPEIPPEDYVLSKFRKDELPVIKEAIKTASNAVESILTDGINKAMNQYNRKPKP